MEVWTDQYCGRRLFDTRIKTAGSLPAGFEISHQGINVVFRNGPAERAPRQVLQDASRADSLIAGRCALLRPANENAFATGGLRHSGGIERSHHGDAVDHSWSAQTPPKRAVRSGVHKFIGLNLGPLYKGDHNVVHACPDLKRDVREALHDLCPAWRPTLIDDTQVLWSAQR